MAFGRPTNENPKVKNLNIRLSMEEWIDIRKVAIARNMSLTDLVREWTAKEKTELVEAGKWPDGYER